MVDDATELELEVAAIHDERGYRHVREALSLSLIHISEPTRPY